MPREISIIKPNSFCPKCKKPIRWYENIPILSYFFLKGKCSRCKNPISIHYPIIEAMTGFLFLYSFHQFGLGLEFFFYAFFFSSLIAVSGIDFSYQIIPDIISVPGLFIGLIFQITKGNLVIGLIGMAFGGGLIFLIRLIGGWVYKKEVMGLGDVYLTAMIGMYVGFPFIIVAIFLAALIGSIFGITYIISARQSKESPIPFGPFLSAGGALVIIIKPQIIHACRMLGIYL
jgi:leader peptidase (prepilin peptidase)/N-methyltransferase